MGKCLPFVLVVKAVSLPRPFTVSQAGTRCACPGRRCNDNMLERLHERGQGHVPAAGPAVIGVWTRLGDDCRVPRERRGRELR